MTDQLFAGAVTFEPSAEQLEVTCRQLALFWPNCAIVDNSVSSQGRRSVERASTASKIPLVGGGTNTGTSGGLNELVRIASRDGSRWLLYLDQDSRLDDAFVARLASLDSLDPSVAAVGSTYARDRAQEPILDSSRWSNDFIRVGYVIASGTCWRLDSLLAVGGCDERFFLDLVDHELCLRLRRAGQTILVDRRRRIWHPIGDDSVTGPFGIQSSLHPAWRRRLMWRNSVLLVRRYWREFPSDCCRHMCVRLVETVLGQMRWPGRLYVVQALIGALQGAAASKARRGLPLSV